MNTCTEAGVRRTQRGLSLIEMMIALAVLGIGLVAILNAIPVIYRTAARAQSMTISSVLAADVYAKLKGDITWPPTTYPATTTDFEPFDAPFTDFEWRRDVENANSLIGGNTSASTYLKMVKITVRYPFIGAYRSVQFVTYATNYSTM